MIQHELIEMTLKKVSRRSISRHIATSVVIRCIILYITKENSLTISLMAARCHISVDTAFRIIRDIVHAECRKKKQVHRLNSDVFEKRRTQAWRMYGRLSNEKYKNDVTVDEVWFYFDASQGVPDIYYVRSNEQPAEAKKKERNDLYPAIVLVWADVNAHGKTQLRFVKDGSRITAKYNIEHIIEPFIKYDILRLFPGASLKQCTLSCSIRDIQLFERAQDPNYNTR